MEIRTEVPAAGIGAGAVTAAERPVITIRVVAPAVVVFTNDGVPIHHAPIDHRNPSDARIAESCRDGL